MGNRLLCTALWAICCLLMLDTTLLPPAPAWAHLGTFTVDVSVEGQRDVNLEPNQSRVIRVVNAAGREVKIRFSGIPQGLSLKFTTSHVNPTQARGQAVTDAHSYPMIKELELEAKVANSKPAALNLVLDRSGSQRQITLTWQAPPPPPPPTEAQTTKAKADAEAKPETIRTLVCLGVLFLLLVGVGIAAWTQLNKHRVSDRHAQLPPYGPPAREGAQGAAPGHQRARVTGGESLTRQVTGSTRRVSEGELREEGAPRRARPDLQTAEAAASRQTRQRAMGAGADRGIARSGESGVEGRQASRAAAASSAETAAQTAELMKALESMEARLGQLEEHLQRRDDDMYDALTKYGEDSRRQVKELLEAELGRFAKPSDEIVERLGGELVGAGEAVSEIENTLREALKALSSDPAKKRFLKSFSEQAQTLVAALEAAAGALGLEGDLAEQMDDVAASFQGLGSQARGLVSSKSQRRLNLPVVPSESEPFLQQDAASNTSRAVKMVTSPEEYFATELDRLIKDKALAFLDACYARKPARHEAKALQQLGEALGLEDTSPAEGEQFNAAEQQLLKLEPGVRDQILEVGVRGYRYKNKELRQPAVVVGRG